MKNWLNAALVAALGVITGGCEINARSPGGGGHHEGTFGDFSDEGGASCTRTARKALRA